MTDVVNIGSNPNDGTGDPLRTAFSKLNAFLADLGEQVSDIDAAQESGMLGFATLAALNADLAHADGTVAIVTNDPTPANNIVYRKSGASGAGSWVAQAAGAWASAAVVADLQAEVDVLASYINELAPEDPAFAVIDGEGKSALDVDQEGLTRLSGLKADVLGTLLKLYTAAGAAVGNLDILEALPGYVLAMEDDAGKVPFGIKDDGTLVCGRMEVDTLQVGGADAGEVAMVIGNFQAEIVHVPCYGQSWSVGIGTYDAISGPQRFDNISFNGGVRTQSISDDPGVVYTSFIPLAERVDSGTPEFPTSVSGETPATGQTDVVKELLLAENHIAYTQQSYQILCSTPGEGSKSITDLSKPSVYYTRLMDQIQAAFDLAQTAGKTYGVPAITWVQGGPSNPGNYATLLETLRDDIETDAVAITGQTYPLKLITWQRFGMGNAPTTEAAQCFNDYIKAAEDHEHIICAGPSYFFDQQFAASVHLAPTSNKWLGAYLGLAYKRTVIDGVKFQPLKPVSFTRQGKVLLVKFNPPRPPLVFDAERVALATNYGFELYTQAGAPLTITSVALAGPDTVKILAQNTLAATDRLIYGCVGTGYGRITGQRGNLRDSQGDTIVFDGGGLNLPLHNWCVIFDKAIG